MLLTAFTASVLVGHSKDVQAIFFDIKDQHIISFSPRELIAWSSEPARLDFPPDVNITSMSYNPKHDICVLVIMTNVQPSVRSILSGGMEKKNDRKETLYCTMNLKENKWEVQRPQEKNSIKTVCTIAVRRSGCYIELSVVGTLRVRTGQLLYHRRTRQDRRDEGENMPLRCE